MLIKRTDEVALASTDLEVGLIHAPPTTEGQAVRARRGDEMGCERLDPGIDGARIDAYATFGQPRGDIGVTQAIAEIPADRQGDDVIREAVAMIAEPDRAGIRRLQPLQRYSCRPCRSRPALVNRVPVHRSHGIYPS